MPIFLRVAGPATARFIRQAYLEAQPKTAVSAAIVARRHFSGLANEIPNTPSKYTLGTDSKTPSSSSTFIVPEGASYVNIFHVIWTKLKEGTLMNIYKEDKDYLDEDKYSPQQVAALFAKRTRMERNVGDRVLGVDFLAYPKVNSSRFDRHSNRTAQELILKYYNETPPAKRFDPYDSYGSNPSNRTS